MEVDLWHKRTRSPERCLGSAGSFGSGTVGSDFNAVMRVIVRASRSPETSKRVYYLAEGPMNKPSAAWADGRSGASREMETCQQMQRFLAIERDDRFAASLAR